MDSQVLRLPEISLQLASQFLLLKQEIELVIEHGLQNHVGHYIESECLVLSIVSSSSANHLSRQKEPGLIRHSPMSGQKLRVIVSSASSNELPGLF